LRHSVELELRLVCRYVGYHLPVCLLRLVYIFIKQVFQCADR